MPIIPSVEVPAIRCEVRSDGMVEMLFQFRQEGCRKRAENAAPVKTQEVALPSPRPFALTYQWRLLVFAPAVSVPGRRSRRTDKPAQHGLGPALHSVKCDSPTVHGKS